MYWGTAGKLRGRRHALGATLKGRRITPVVSGIRSISTQSPKDLWVHSGENSSTLGRMRRAEPIRRLDTRNGNRRRLATKHASTGRSLVKGLSHRIRNDV